jgi:hypothetical protein
MPIVVFDSSITAISATSIVTGRNPGNSVVAPTAETATVAVPATTILMRGGRSRQLFRWHDLMERPIQVKRYSKHARSAVNPTLGGYVCRESQLINR